MPDGADPGEGAHGDFIGGVDADDLVDADRLTLTPEQHERIKERLHAADGPFEDLRRADRRYLVIGRGGGEPGERRERVRDLLDARPGASAFRLEDFGFTGEDLDLWAPAFDLLSEMATHVVGVLEDFDGGHVWELGYLYRQGAHVRNVLWLLKRVYGSEDEMREHYDNGMAASHLAALEAAVGDRVVRWEEPADLPEAVAAIS